MLGSARGREPASLRVQRLAHARGPAAAALRERGRGRHRSRRGESPPMRRSTPARQRALVPTGLVLQLPAGLRGAGPAALRPRAQARRHRAQRAGHHRLPIIAARCRCILINLRSRALRRHPRHAHRPARRSRRSRRSSLVEVDERGRDRRAPRAASARPASTREDEPMHDTVCPAAACSPSRPSSTSRSTRARCRSPRRRSRRGTTCRSAISRPVLQALVRHGILKGVRGPRGGYELARERRRITAGDIVRVGHDGDRTRTIPRRCRNRASSTLVVGPLVERGHRGVSGGARRRHGRGSVPAGGRREAAVDDHAAGGFHDLES